MKLRIEVNENDLKQMVVNHINNQLPTNVEEVTVENVDFTVQSKENYRANTWEVGKLRVIVERDM